MVRKLSAILTASLVLGTAAHAITFNNFVYSSSPLSDGASESFAGNAISFFTPNAVVGDGATSGLRAGTLKIQYDADAGSSIFAVGIYANLGAPVIGSGTVRFTETVWAYNTFTNTVGAVLGTATHTFDAASGFFYSGSITLSTPSSAIRVEKKFELDAQDTIDFDLASVAIVNQNLVTSPVPEPATMAVLGLGLAAIARRRRPKA